jgi:hypothetical protein
MHRARTSLFLRKKVLQEVPFHSDPHFLKQCHSGRTGILCLPWALELLVSLEHGTEPETACVVHIQHTHSGTAHGGHTNDAHVGQHKVVVPGMHTGIEQRDKCPRVGVKTRQI